MFKQVLCAAVAATVVLGVATAADASARRQIMSANLIHNGDAEAAPGSSDGSVVVVPDWTITAGTGFTAVQYGASGGFPTSTDPGPVQRGANFLTGGPFDGVSTATQHRFLASKFFAPIDAGTVVFALRGFLGGYSSQEDNAIVRVDWMNGHGVVLGSNTIGPVTATNRSDRTGLKMRTLTAMVPVKTRQALITLTMTRKEGSYNDGSADNLSLKVMMPTAG
jgi:hypothetical protein